MNDHNIKNINSQASYPTLNPNNLFYTALLKTISIKNRKPKYQYSLTFQTKIDLKILLLDILESCYQSMQNFDSDNSEFPNLVRKYMYKRKDPKLIITPFLDSDSIKVHGTESLFRMLEFVDFTYLKNSNLSKDMAYDLLSDLILSINCLMIAYIKQDSNMSIIDLSNNKRIFKHLIKLLEQGINLHVKFFYKYTNKYKMNLIKYAYEVLSQLRTNINKVKKDIKVPELDDTSRCLIFGYKVAMIKSYNTILGVCSGGVLPTLYVNYFIRYKYNSKPNIYIFRYSRYNNLSKFSLKNTNTRFYEALLIDDNSNTGLTTQNIIKEVHKKDPTSHIDVAIVEADIFRALYKKLKASEEDIVHISDFYNIASPYLFRFSVGITPITYDHPIYKDFLQIRKINRSILRLKNLSDLNYESNI